MGHTNSVSSVTVTSDYKYIISASLDKSIKIWNFTSHKVVGVISNLYQSIFSTITVSKDNNYLISGSSNGRIIVYSMESGTEIASLGGFSKAITQITTTYNG